MKYQIFQNRYTNQRHQLQHDNWEVHYFGLITIIWYLRTYF